VFIDFGQSFTDSSTVFLEFFRYFFACFKFSPQDLTDFFVGIADFTAFFIDLRVQALDFEGSFCFLTKSFSEFFSFFSGGFNYFAKFV
jgi:hypothetical protein